MDVADEKWLNDYGEVESNKFNGTPSNGSLENQTRCAPLREQFYKCAREYIFPKLCLADSLRIYYVFLYFELRILELFIWIFELNF